MTAEGMPSPLPASEPRPADRPGRLTVGVLGAGRVGTTLGAALSLAGHRVVAATAVSEASRDRALVAGMVAADVPVTGKLLVHTSGRYGIGVLEPAVRAGALPLALHPVMAFTGRSDDLNRLAGISFGVTAPDPLRPVAEATVRAASSAEIMGSTGNIRLVSPSSRATGWRRGGRHWAGNARSR